jgi:membrane protease YdiL (CAAX protease family)
MRGGGAEVDSVGTVAAPHRGPVPRRGCSGWLRAGVRDAPRHIGLGVLIGSSLIVIVMLVGQPAGWYRVTFSGIDGRWLEILGLLTIGAILQELVFRGLVYNVVEWLFGSAFAVLTTAALFGALHFAYPEGGVREAVVLALQFGVLLSVGYAATRSLWFVIALNLSWTVTAGLVFGAPVSGFVFDSHPLFRTEVTGSELWSGGPFGPEAGLPALALSSAVAILLISWGQGNGRFRGPWWTRRRLRRAAG